MANLSEYVEHYNTQRPHRGSNCVHPSHNLPLKSRTSQPSIDTQSSAVSSTNTTKPHSPSNGTTNYWNPTGPAPPGGASSVARSHPCGSARRSTYSVERWCTRPVPMTRPRLMRSSKRSGKNARTNQPWRSWSAASCDQRWSSCVPERQDKDAATVPDARQHSSAEQVKSARSTVGLADGVR